MLKGKKKTLKIAGFSVGGVILFLLTIYIMLQTSMIQKTITNALVKELSAKLHTKVTVGEINYKLFNAVTIHNLYVEDLHRDTLLFVNQADAHFSFWKIFRGKIIFHSVDLNRIYGNLLIDKEGHSNLDFVIDAFKTPSKKDSTQLIYRFNHIRIKDSRFTLTNLKEMQPVPAGLLNPNSLNVKNINADISFDILKKDSFNISVSEFNAQEKTGLVISHFKTRIAGSAKGVKIPKVDLSMPFSEIHLKNLELNYDSIADLQRFASKVRWNAPIESSTIAFSDLKCFVPEFKNVNGIATFKGLITGRLKNMRFQKMEIKYGNSFMLNADLDVNGLPDIREAFIYGQIKDLHFQKSDIQDFISDLTRKPFVLPDELNQLGLIHYRGNITGFLNNLVLFGNLTTNVGNISSDVSLRFENKMKDLIYNGTVKTEYLAIGKLLNDKNIGNIAFNVNTKGTKKESSAVQGTIEASVPEFHWNNYTYRDVKFNGKYDGKGFDGTADVEDENIDAHFTGKIDLTNKLPLLDFNLEVNNTNLNALKVTNQYPGALLSFNANTNIVGNSLDNLNGTILLNKITFTNQNKTLNIDKIKLVSRTEPEKTLLTVSSDFLNGSINGKFTYSSLANSINKIVQNYLPSLATTNKKEIMNTQNHINIDLKLSNTRDVSEVLVLPYELQGISTFKGFIDEKSNKIDISGEVPTLKSNKQLIENIAIHIENPHQQLQFTSRAQLQTKDEILRIFLKASAAKDTIGVNMGWQNNNQITNAGEINALAHFRATDGKLAAKLNIRPTQVIVADSVWNIHPCRIDFNPDSTIQIRNFSFDKHNEFIHINGIASKNRNDSVTVSMNKLDLDFIMGLLKLKGISIGGIATGKATLLSALEQPIFEANIKVKDFKLNHKVVGDANVFSTWDKENSRLFAHGFFTGDKNDTIVRASGYFTPRTDTIDIQFDAKKFSLEFLSYYFDPVARNVKGYASGKIRMFGPLKHGVSFVGDGYVYQGQATIKVLNTSYFIDDSVHLTKKTIEFRNVKVYDQERNPAYINGGLSHNGLFQHMKFDVNMKGQNVLALNTHAEDNDYFFGKAYANGTVHIYGDEKEANILVNAVSQPNTKCYIQMGGASKASDNSFINFVNKRIYSRKDSLLAHKSTANDMNVKVNLQIEVNPNADMELIVDPKGGDVITGKGNGNLRVEFDTYSDIKLYGTYTINSGYYLFTLQNLFRKEFKIDQGSTLNWTGDPYNAQGNIRALYPLTASLKDLLEETATSSTQSSRSSIPVNCVLKLTDNIMKPTVKFDIDLPQSDEGVKQRVRNVINTEEMMNRQILYLLVFNKFYMPDYMKAAATANLGASEAISFGVSTFSAQFNNLISQTFKTNKWNVGFDYRTNDLQNSDVKAQILYQPNDRLIINGNLGYRFDNIPNAVDANKFIGDIDLEWLLTNSGKVRFKAYNHTIDRYQLLSKTSLFSQGVGFIYKEDFNSVSDLLNYYWSLLTVPKTKKSEEKNEPAKK